MEYGVSGKHSRNKGNSAEREVVNWHRSHGIDAERVPLSGAMDYQGNHEDVDIYPFTREYAPLCCQVKRFKTGMRGIKKALGDADALFFREDREPWLVIVPMETWKRLVVDKK
jgi:hypothetical protein